MSCHLCGLNSNHLIVEQDKSFCCIGCRAVFRIIETKNESPHKDHPLYKQAVKSGLISNPDFLKNLHEEKGQKERVFLEIGSMWCSSCAEVIRYFTLSLKGVSSAKVDYATDLALIEYDPKVVGEDRIIQIIQEAGYDPSRINEKLKSKKNRKLLFRLGIASFCALNLMMFTYPLYFGGEGQEELKWLSLFFTLPVIFYSGIPFYYRAFQAMRAGITGMDLLVTLGVIASFILSLMGWQEGLFYFDTLAIIISFLLFGKWIENESKSNSQDRLYSLLKHLPQKVRRQNGEFVLLKEIKVGDVLQYGLGEMIALKGSIVSGEGWVSEKAINGEADPIYKRQEDFLRSGSTLISGSLLVKAEEPFQNSLVNQIMQACETSFQEKTANRLIDSYLQYLVPVIIAVALIAALVMGASSALALLLIACPCAIGIASPLVESRMLSAFAKEGALVKNRGAFDALAKCRLFVFDKTGTVTKGDLTLKKKPEYENIIHGMTRISFHPLALALHKYTQGDLVFDTLWEIPGKGIKGLSNNTLYHLGSAAFLEAEGVENSFTSDHTHVILAINKKAVECIEFEDQLRQDMDLPEPRFLLSGDQEKVVSRVARQLGFQGWKSGQSPIEKEAFIKSCEAPVVFIGDGINDAPSLSRAACGIAMGDSLSLTQAASDILLTHDDLSSLKRLQKLAQKGQHLILQNTFWAVFYNFLALPLAFMGFLTPLMASLAMVLSSLMVIINSHRIKIK